VNARVLRCASRQGWFAAVGVSALLVASIAHADAPGSVTQPSQGTQAPRTREPPAHAGSLLAGRRPEATDDAAREAERVAAALAELTRTPGAEAAAGALTQAREALGREARLREEGDARRAARALAVARAALELAGRQAALARERSAEQAAQRTREAARARARAAREALAAAQRPAEAAAQPTQAGSDAASDTRGDTP